MFFFSSKVFQNAAQLEFLPPSLRASFNKAANYFEQHERKNALFPILQELLSEVAITQEEACWQIANSVHETKTRRNGQPVMTHIEAVVNTPDLYADIVYTPNQRMLAIVHDTGEDSCGAWTANDFRILGFDKEFCLGFDGMTRREGELYFDSIERGSKTIAPPVKIGDNRHNWRDGAKPLHAQRYRIASHYDRDVIIGKIQPGSNIAEWACRSGMYNEKLFKKYSSRPLITNYSPPQHLAHMSGIPAPGTL